MTVVSMLQGKSLCVLNTLIVPLAVSVFAVPVGIAAQDSQSWRVTDAMFPAGDERKEELGRLLFFDKILSGNENISCASCHHPFAATGDGLSLPVGTGGTGFGVARETSGQLGQQVFERVPRNAPALFNLGADDFSVLFHDGRLAVDHNQPSGFLNPAGDDLPSNLESVLAAQAMFPVTSAAEMAGQPGENAIADAAAANNLAGADGVWALLADRLRANTEYVDLFIEAFEHIDSAADISYQDASNAIGAFEAAAYRCTDTPFDRAVGSDGALQQKSWKDSLSPKVIRGEKLFYGKAQCADCHSGPFQTDQSFHAIAVPQVGPGKGDGADGHDDFGRERVTADAADRYKFRTPSLRQVAYTGPWGHDGAYNSLVDMIKHHLNPVEALENYDTSQLVLASRPDLDAQDLIAHNDPAHRADIAAANELERIPLDAGEIGDIVEFLRIGLTDTSCTDLRRDVPQRVPSGIPIAD
ncbi:MAG: cytochrome-c peroxidase [Gammaproteobacteria bacterium]|nr:cytochrome-c peroxidase [Gammaproteobacteria bacterium]